MATTVTLVSLQTITRLDGTPISRAAQTIVADGVNVYRLAVGGIPLVGDAQAYLNGIADQLLTEAQQVGTADSNALTDKTAQDDIRARWIASVIHGKTPAQIYTAMQGAIDGWGSLAAAKADLRTWLPLMAAALAWMVMKDDQR